MNKKDVDRNRLRRNLVWRKREKEMDKKKERKST